MRCTLLFPFESLIFGHFCPLSFSTCVLRPARVRQGLEHTREVLRQELAHRLKLTLIFQLIKFGYNEFWERDPGCACVRALAQCILRMNQVVSQLPRNSRQCVPAVTSAVLQLKIGLHKFFQHMNYMMYTKCGDV